MKGRYQNEIRRNWDRIQEQENKKTTVKHKQSWVTCRKDLSSFWYFLSFYFSICFYRIVLDSSSAMHIGIVCITKTRSVHSSTMFDSSKCLKSISRDSPFNFIVFVVLFFHAFLPHRLRFQLSCAYLLLIHCIDKDTQRALQYHVRFFVNFSPSKLYIVMISSPLK